MPRFYFDLVGCDDEFRDEEGLVFADAREAKRNAEVAAEDLVKEARRFGIAQSPHTRYEVYNDRRELVAMVPVGPFVLY